VYVIAIYAFALREGAIAYTITDVLDLHNWMTKHFDAHPLFERIPMDELKDDPCIEVYSHTLIPSIIIAKTIIIMLMLMLWLRW
jgi:tRNA G46 methylase TrmB